MSIFYFQKISIIGARRRKEKFDELHTRIRQFLLGKKVRFIPEMGRAGWSLIQKNAVSEDTKALSKYRRTAPSNLNSYQHESIKTALFRITTIISQQLDTCVHLDLIVYFRSSKSEKRLLRSATNKCQINPS